MISNYFRAWIFAQDARMWENQQSAEVGS